MAVFTTHANRCDVCSHEWLGKPDATHCASTKCRSRRWNASAAKTQPVPKYEYETRPAHAISCKCGMCKAKSA